MKLTLNRDTVLPALMGVAAVAKGGRQGEVGHDRLLLEADTSGITLIACSPTQCQLVARAEAVVVTPGSAVLPASKLLDIARALGNGASLDLSRSGKTPVGRVTLRAGRSMFRLQGTDPDSFPVIETPERLASLALGAGDLATALEQVAPSMANNDVRYYLNAALVDMTAQPARLVTTDGHRLALRQLPATAESTGEGKFLLPRETVLLLARLLRQRTEGEAVSVALGSTLAEIAVGELRLTTRLVDGSFPDYERVIPSEHDQTDALEIDRGDLTGSLKRILAGSESGNRGVHPVVLSRAQGGLALDASGGQDDEGAAHDEIPMRYQGEGDIRAAFNRGYLADAASVIHEDRLHLHLGRSPSTPGTLRGADSNDLRVVLMPVRLEGG